MANRCFSQSDKPAEETPEEDVYLRDREDPEGYLKREILSLAEVLVEEGYRKGIH